MDPRAINFNVLRRHDARISSILDSTSYAVIYRYFHGAWSKTGFEGTLFIFQRDTLPHNGVFVLNRQGLDNLCEGLLAGWDVDLDEGLIIWRSAGATGDADDDIIYGIWVYEEKDRTRIATTMQELINGASAQATPSPPPVSLSHPVPRVPIISAGQTISLDQLFGVGSVCSEPPPQTSALPHPGTSVADTDEILDNVLPPQIFSPDASDLPKGMQLLDSLFQKAAIKSQNSHHHPPPKVNSMNQQLLTQPSAFTSKGPSHISPTKSTPTKTRRDRHQSSNAEETYKNQSTTVTQSTQLNHRVINPTHTSRSDHRALNYSNNNSRRSSGGSSRSQNDQLPMGNNHNSQTHQHAQLLAHLNSSSQASVVAAPVAIENSNAEARHNILSLLGHPAATRSDDVYTNPRAANPPNPTILASPSDQAIVSSQETADHHHSNNPRCIHHSEQGHHTSTQPLINPTNGSSNPGSQAASQQPSPSSNAQQPFIHHALPTPSYGSFADPSPPRAAHIQSATHSPNGPRPQVDSGRHHQSPKNPPSGSPSSAPNVASGGPVFSTSVWPFNKLTPSRALSPLNPARQSPSIANHHTRASAAAAATSGNYRPSNNHPHHARHLPPHQQRDLLDHTPPEINDSSRPIKPDIKPDSYPSHASKNYNKNRTNKHDPHDHNDNILSISPTLDNKNKITEVHPKLAVQSLDELLILDHHSSLATTTNPHHVEGNGPLLDLNTHTRHDLAPLDKSQFVNDILNLIHNNGPFVDTLYARYLARCAEKYL